MILHQCPSSPMSPRIPFSPYMIDCHLKIHSLQDFIYSRDPITLHPVKSILRVWSDARTQQSPSHSNPNHIVITTCEKEMVSSFILLPTQQITQTLIRSPVDRRFFIASQMMKENIGTACVNQTKVLNRLSHTCFLFVPMSY